MQNEVDLHTITNDLDPDEIHVDDATVTWYIEAYKILHLHWFLVDGCHTTSISRVPYWVIILPLYVESLVDHWCRPDGVPSGLTWVDIGAKIHSDIMSPPAPVSTLTHMDPMHQLAYAVLFR